MSDEKMRYCFNCGDELGVYKSCHYDRMDDCGKNECSRAARDYFEEERESAHEQLDRDLGYDHNW